MRTSNLFFGTLVILTVGCQHVSLRNHTERQARTLTELQYTEVLDNIAMFSENQESMPFFSTAVQGTTSNNYSVNPIIGLAAPWSGTMGGSITANEQWSTNSVLNPDELRLMRCIYQHLVGKTNCDCNCDADMKAFFTGTCYLDALQTKWFCVGNRKDVPSCAAYVGHFNNTFVWVMPDNVNSLTQITMAMLDLATAATPLSIPDAGADKINKLIARAKDLSLILSQYPLIQGEMPSEAYKNTKRDLDNTLQELNVAMSGTKAAQTLDSKLHFRARKDQMYMSPSLSPTIQPGR